MVVTHAGKVESADTTNADWIRMTLSAGARPATPEMMIAGVTQPTIIATTCCSASGNAREKDGIPSSSKRDAFDLVSPI